MNLIMVVFMKVNGKKVKDMVEENRFGPMDLYTKDIGMRM